MSGHEVDIEKRGRVAIVRFDRGHRANALSLRLTRALHEAAQTLDGDPDLSAVVLTGAPGGNFSCGLDLADPDTRAVFEGDVAERRRASRLGSKLCRAWEELEPITIAAVEGWCVGGGVALAVACDLRIAGQSATFYAAEIERGMSMSWGTVPRVVNLVGPAKAKRVIVMAERLAAERAHAWGLIDEVVPDGTALPAALEMAERIAALPPLPVRMCKQAINAAATALGQAVSAVDADQNALALGTADAAESLQAYREGRPPRFTGR
jgi:enoyl-CoA hydratase/carnithine racemase